MDWRRQAGIRGGKLAAKLSRENGTTTPLAGSARPQTPQGKRPDATNNRPDGLQRSPAQDRPGVPGKGSPGRNDPPIPQKPCARKACQKPFTPTRPNQAYCPGDCRQRALEERKVEGLTIVLEELAGAAEELRQFANGHNDPMYSRMVALAEKAATALHTHRTKK